MSKTKRLTISLEENVGQALLAAKITRMRWTNRSVPMTTVINDVLRVGLHHMGYRVDGTDWDRMNDNVHPDPVDEAGVSPMWDDPRDNP